MRIEGIRARRTHRRNTVQAAQERQTREDSLSPPLKTISDLMTVTGGAAGLGIYVLAPRVGRVAQLLSGSMLGFGGGLMIPLLTTSASDQSEAGQKKLRRALIAGAGVFALGVIAGASSNPIVGAAVTAAGGALLGGRVAADIVEQAELRRPH